MTDEELEYLKAKDKSLIAGLLCEAALAFLLLTALVYGWL